MSEEKIEEPCYVSALNLKNVGEVPPEAFTDDPIKDAWWAEVERLAAEIADDDPRLEADPRKISFDDRTKERLSAKHLVRTRNSMAELAVIWSKRLGGNE